LKAIAPRLLRVLATSGPSGAFFSRMHGAPTPPASHAPEPQQAAEVEAVGDERGVRAQESLAQRQPLLEERPRPLVLAPVPENAPDVDEAAGHVEVRLAEQLSPGGERALLERKGLVVQPEAGVDASHRAHEGGPYEGPPVRSISRSRRDLKR
jgi:hypothetical protein